MDHNILKKNGNVFAENWQNSLKIVIITLTPGLHPADSIHLLHASANLPFVFLLKKRKKAQQENEKIEEMCKI
jgi:hypothetical protein